MKFFPRLYEENVIVDTLVQRFICWGQKEKFGTNLETDCKNASSESASICTCKYLTFLCVKWKAGTEVTANNNFGVFKHIFHLSGCSSKMSFLMISHYPQVYFLPQIKKKKIMLHPSESETIQAAIPYWEN